ncbi:MAG: MFS transporter [Pseudomonadota bacterium]
MHPARDPAIWALAVGELLIWGGTMYLFPALLPWWEPALGWDKTDLTLMFTGSVVVSALLSPLAGNIIDRGYGRLLICGSAMATVVLLLLLSGTTDKTMFLLLWLGLGVCMAGALYDPCFAFLVRTRGDGARQAITMVTLVAGFAGTLAFPLNAFIAEAFGWQRAVQCYAGLIVGVALPCFWFGTRRHGSGEMAEPVRASVPLRHDAAFLRALRTSAFWLVALAYAAMYLNHNTVLTHLLPMLKERGVNLEFAVLTIALIGPSQVAGRAAMIGLERWFSTRMLSVASLACLILASGCLLFAAHHPALLIAFAVLQGGGVGIASITRPVVIADLLGRTSFGAIAGAVALPVMLCMAIAPSSGAAIWNVGGYGLVFNVNLGVIALGALALAIAVLRGPAPWVAAESGGEPDAQPSR